MLYERICLKSDTTKYYFIIFSSEVVFSLQQVWWI